MKRRGAHVLALAALATILAACAGAKPPQLGTPAFPPPGPDCEAICHHQYKECANGSRCMMVAQCDMEVCIPEKQDCLAHCASGH